MYFSLKNVVIKMMLTKSFQGEPFPVARANQGLRVILDAHTDLVEAFSVDSIYGGFIASVTSPGEYPHTLHVTIS